MSALIGCLPLAISHPTKHTTFYAGSGWTSMDGISCLSHIIPYNQYLNICYWTALDSKMADGVGFEPTIRGYRIHAFQACAFSHSATRPRRRIMPKAAARCNGEMGCLAGSISRPQHQLSTLRRPAISTSAAPGFGVRRRPQWRWPRPDRSRTWYRSGRQRPGLPITEAYMRRSRASAANC